MKSALLSHGNSKSVIPPDRNNLVRGLMISSISTKTIWFPHRLNFWPNLPNQTNVKSVNLKVNLMFSHWYFVALSRTAVDHITVDIFVHNDYNSCLIEQMRQRDRKEHADIFICLSETN